MDALLSTMLYVILDVPGVTVKKVAGSGNRNCYCQFTGGGDIHVQSKGKGKSLVICNTQPDEDDLSKSDIDPSDLSNKLLANTILCCVAQFVTNCQDKGYSAEFLRTVTQLSGYSVAYTGMGHVGFYKLNMNFNKPMDFVAKIKPGVHYKPLSATYVDYAMEYFFRKIRQPKEHEH